jgi:hypothetical protein
MDVDQPQTPETRFGFTDACRERCIGGVARCNGHNPPTSVDEQRDGSTHVERDFGDRSSHVGADRRTRRNPTAIEQGEVMALLGTQASEGTVNLIDA